MKRLGPSYWMPLIAGLGCWLSVAHAAEGPAPIRLEEVVVTANHSETRVTAVPKPVTVIDRETLDRMPGATLTDILGREAGILPRGLFGSGKKSGIDIRGMGDTFGSNVLILLNGMPMNPTDMSGVDFTSIPVESIERIEIVRGAGSATWGNGAVGGVVQIFTKKPEGFSGKISSETGSFNSLKNSFTASGTTGPYQLGIAGRTEKTDGFRDNAGYDARHLDLDAGFDNGSAVRLTVSATLHEDTYGLPGPLSEEEMRENIRQSNSPYDFGETWERRLRGTMDLDLGRLGTLSLSRIWRYADNEFLMTGRATPPLPADKPSTIETVTRTFRAGHTLPFTLWGRQHELHMGLDHQFGHYVRTDPDPNLATRKNGRIQEMGAFGSVKVQATQKLLVSGGWRQHWFDGRYRSDRIEETKWVEEEGRDNDWSPTAWDLGATYDLGHGISLYGSAATSFRVPNIDEFALSDADFGPQEGTHYEAGGRFFVPGVLRASAGVFHMRVEDEIYYDTGANRNRNYDEDTLRKGVEASLELYPLADWMIRLDGTIMSATFEEEDTVIPLVAERHGGVRVEWEPADGLTLAAAGRWFDERYDGNDVENEKDTLDAYWVWDSRVRYAKEHWSLFFELNNILNEEYAYAAYSGSLYPMPGRNFRIGVSLEL